MTRAQAKQELLKYYKRDSSSIAWCARHGMLYRECTCSPYREDGCIVAVPTIVRVSSHLHEPVLGKR